jgi:hypothetical protein
MSKNGTPKQGAGARKQGNKANSKKQSTSASGRIGPFKPTINIPRMLPVASPTSSPQESTSTTTVATCHQPLANAVAPARFVSNEAGILERVGHEADEALAIGKRVLTMLNVESKEYSYSFAPISVDYSGLSAFPIQNITQGDTDSQRDGDSFKLKTWKGALAFTRGGVDAIVAYAFTLEGPTFITQLQQVFEGSGTTQAPLSQPLWDARLGFKVLKHGIARLTASDPYHIVQFDHKFNHDVQFYNNSTTVYQGNVTLRFVSNNAGGGSQPTVSMDSQLSWVDN